MARETHETRLLDYLQRYGSITSLEAIRDLGNTRLSASIFNLKDKGHAIKSESARVDTRWTNSNGSRKQTTVTKYVLNLVSKENNQLSIDSEIAEVKW
tara:strand:- start:3312 stop:3605 length:294 start_codon:yes stop_codon:yes gene_type:complete